MSRTAQGHGTAREARRGATTVAVVGVEDEFYIAWDGRRYAGEPPAGWYLAADNRWWPSQAVVDGDPGPAVETGDGGPTSIPTTTRTPTRSPASRASSDHGRHPDPTPDLEATAGNPTSAHTGTAPRRPPESWAPETGSAPPPQPTTTGRPPGPGTPAPTGGRSQQRGRRRGGIPWRFLIIGFVLYRCVASSFESEPAPSVIPAPTFGVPATTVAPTTGAPTTGAVGGFTTTAPPLDPASDPEVDVAISTCQSGLVTGTVENLGDDAQLVTIQVAITTADSEVGAETSIRVEPGDSRPWIVTTGDTAAPEGCELVQFTTEAG